MTEQYGIVTETPERFQDFKNAVDTVSNIIANINELRSKYPDDFNAWITELPENLKNLYEETNAAQQALMTNKISKDERQAKQTAIYMQIAKNSEKSADLTQLSQILKRKDLEKSRERHNLTN